MKITKLPYAVGYKVVKDVKNIHSVASISENGETHGITFTNNTNGYYKGAPMLNHRGKKELLKRCKARLKKQAQKYGANAILNFSCVSSLASSGSGISSGDSMSISSDDANDCVCACNILAGGEAVVIKKSNK